MSTSIENETLLISLIGIEQRNRNAIEMVFEQEQSGLYAFADANEASLTIVDLDNYGAADEWAALQQIKPDQLAILFSVNEIPQASSHFCLKKPVSISELVVALQDAKSKLDIGEFSDQLNKSSWNRLFSFKEKKTKEKFIQKKPEPEQAVQEVYFFSEQGYLIDEVKRAVVQANSEGRGIKLQLNNQGSIFIDPTEHWVNTDLVPAVLKDLCQHSLNETDIVKRIFNDLEFSKYLEEWQGSKLKPIDIDSFLWDLALWTYGGSLPASTDLSKKITLTYWPDLPRLTPTPNSMRIAALWVSCPMTLMETTEVLKIPQKDVFNFYVAASTLGLIKQSGPVDKSSDGPKDVNNRMVNSETSKQQFYNRILNHLKRNDLDE